LKKKIENIHPTHVEILMEFIGTFIIAISYKFKNIFSSYRTRKTNPMAGKVCKQDLLLPLWK